MRWTFLLLALPVAWGLSFCGLWGCAGTGSREDGRLDGPTALERAEFVKFADVPVPAGFAYVPAGSYCFESSGVRAGALRYRGRADDPDRVVAFFKEQMPLHDWSLLNVSEYGEYLLNFDREGETCIVRLVPDGHTMTITISLGPAGASSRKSTRPARE